VVYLLEFAIPERLLWDRERRLRILLNVEVESVGFVAGGGAKGGNDQGSLKRLGADSQLRWEIFV
jgi:hypothetical protein